MGKKRVGLYFGTGSVGVALKEGKKVLSLSSADLSSVEAKESDTLDKDLHWQALIRKSLRQANAESKKVFLSLADRDFIIRSLEMPLMGKGEIESALIYEVEKYIPFKPEELIWDYQYDRIPKEKKIRVSFVGIRRASLARVKKILKNIELETIAIEPSCLSLARILKINKKNDKQGNFALLDLSSQEAYLTFFQKDLPVFNRYLSLKKREGKLDIDNFVEAVNFSFQYFWREFKKSKLDKIFVLTSEFDLNSLASSLGNSLSMPVEKLKPADLASQSQASIENLKALGCASRDESSYKFKPILKGLEEAKAEKDLSASNVAWNWGLLAGVFVLALAVYFLFSFYLNNSLAQESKNLEVRKESVSVSEEIRQADSRDIQAYIEEKEKKVQKLESLKKGKVELADFLKIFTQGEVVPSEIWLENVVVEKGSPGRYKARITGYAYKGDSYQERAKVNDFVANLREQAVIRSLFDVVELPSTRRREIQYYAVTQFFVEMR